MLSQTLRRLIPLAFAGLLSLGLRAEPVISEFLADNVTGAEDEDGNREDWIEIFNPDDTPVNLAGWRLTDNAANLAKWTFPAVVIPPKGYLVVWASNKNRNAGQLHTNFKLDAAGEYLALVRPDGSVAFDFSPIYPPQAPDTAYGVPVTEAEEVLVASGSPARVLVPTNATNAATWMNLGHDDSTWSNATAGVGFDLPAAPTGASGLWANSVSEFSGVQGQSNWFYGLYQRNADANGVYDADDFTTTYIPLAGDGTSRAWTFAGGVWDVIPGNAPWSTLTNTGGHPNGQAIGGYQATVRRWISEFTGTARVTGRMGHGGGCGDGVTHRIFVEGMQVYARTVSAATVEYTVTFPVVQGQRVDFYTDPGPSGGDGCDGFTYTARITGEALADSVADWTEMGTQGTRGWTYGFWNRSTDANGVYATGEFVNFPRNTANGNTLTTTNAWDGARWKTASAPLVELTQTGGKPQITGGTNWVIRRWTSTHAGPVRIMGAIGNNGGGDGVTGRVLVNGTQILAKNVNNVTEGFSVLTNLTVGALVDFALDPNATEAGDADSIFTVNIAAAAPSSSIIADSVAQWAGGVQNANGWSHGYYNRTADANGVYNDGDFNNTDPNWVPGWTLGPGDPPWTYVTQLGVHPNSTNNGGEHWAVRRWTSTVDGTVSVDWHFAKQNPFDSGVSLRVFHNGREVAFAAINGNDRVGVAQTTVLRQVRVGDHVDFALTPVGLTGVNNDGADGSTLSARILRTTSSENLTRTLLADSQADWSTSGTQGEKSWYAGYYNRSADGDASYASLDFIAFPRDNGAHSASNFWTGFGWDWFAGNPPWTELAQLGVHPNGTNNGQEHWVIRRWVAVTNGTLDVEWLVRKTNPSGNGVTLKVFRNGTEVDSGAIAGNNTVGLSRTVRVTGVSAGDPIDICITPVGLGGGTDDGADSAQFWAKIYQVRQFSDDIHPAGGVASLMHGVNASAYVRLPFTFTNTLDRLLLSMNYDDGFVAYLNGTEIARRNAPVAQAAGRLADSIAEFGGVQGGNNWYYGYYPQSADPDGNGRYDTGDFVEFPAAGGAFSALNYYTGTAWDWFNTNPPWTFMSSTQWHPNGSNSGPVHWAMRRWVAEQAGTVHAHLAHNKAAVGSGTTARLFHNGREIWTSVTNDPVGNQGYLAITDIRPGDAIDLAVDALGLGGDAGDSSDMTNLSIQLGQMPSAGLAWDAAAVLPRPAADTGIPVNLDLTSFSSLLVNGTNVLAVQGLNSAKDDADFLVAPRLTANTVTANPAGRVYLAVPTPGAHNGEGTATIGPVVASVARLPAGPVAATNAVVVSAVVSKSVDDVAAVRLYHRTMFGAETMIPMVRVAGTAPDGGGTYEASIPAGSALPGEMLRWRVVAEDATGDLMRSPAFADPLNSPEYYGTVIADTNLVSNLPILHTFLASPGAADGLAGTRMSFEYNGAFFDNVFMNLHGQSSSAFPKKSYNVNLNTGHKLRWNPDQPRIKGFSLLTTYPDKANMRNMLAMEAWRDAGGAHHFVFPVQMRRNGAFFSVTHFMEDGDSDFLQRLGLGEQNALYKVYNSLENANLAVNNGNGSEKKSREWEDFSDLQALVTGVAQTGLAEERYLYDNAGVPETVNYLAALFISGNTDTGHKNYYMFRDSDGNREWFPTPWDVDLSFGRVWTGGYFDDVLYANTPLYVSSANRFTGPFLDNSIPAFRNMYLRRVRTLVDTLLQPLSTPVTNRLLEAKIDAYAALMAPDTTLDYNAWPTWGSNQTQNAAVTLLKDYLDRRRAYAYGLADLPPAQATNVVVNFGALEFNPPSGNQAEEYFTLVNTNTVAVDVSGWTITGAVNHTLKPGTVIDAGGTLHLSPDVNAFRARSTSPRGNESRFVQGDYSGQLSARGETLELWDGARLVATNLYAGAATPAQLGLRVTEMDYNPGARPGDAFVDKQEYEFIELMNVWTNTISLAGVTFTNGVDLVLPAVSLAPGERRVVVRNLAAFQSRHPTVATNRVIGVYTGALANGGERVTLLDPSGEEILDFTYSDLWHPLTDGQGYSLTVASETQEPDLWNTAPGWKVSGRISGTPALPDSEGDTDGDGMSDRWETLYGLNPLSAADGAVDGDNDGLTNAQEFVAGTHPGQAASVLALNGETWNATNGQFTGSFAAVAGRSYTVQRSADVGFAAWTRVLDHTAVADGPVSFSDTVPSGTRYYYRVVTPQAP